MAWNKKANPDKKSNMFGQLQNIFLEFLSDYDHIKSFHDNLNHLELNEYKKETKINHERIKNFNNKVKEIYKLVIDLKQTKLEENQVSQIQVIDQSLLEKQKIFKVMIDEIVEQERVLNRKFSFYSLQGKERSSTNSSNSFVSINNQQVQDSSKKASLLAQEIEVKENIIYMEERTKELEDIVKVTHQIKDITGEMKTEVIRQGEKIDKIEDTIVDVKENAVNAHFEIKEAEQHQNKGNICTKIIFIIVIVAIVATISIVLGVVLSK